MTHFTKDNTNGYTAEQLSQANAIIDALDLDPDEYKFACEQVLEIVEEDAEPNITIVASNPTDSGPLGDADHTANGCDVDVVITISGLTIKGGVKLAKESDGSWGPFGDADDCWIDGTLLDVVRAFALHQLLSSAAARAARDYETPGQIYTCWGSVRGGCGQVHTTRPRAAMCLASDERGCSRNGGYSDRRVIAIESADMATEYDVTKGPGWR